jgi:hypothetical protein
MKAYYLLFWGLVHAITGFSYTHFSTQDPGEIRKLLRHHRDLLDDYLIYGVENPGVRILEARVRYIKVVGESGGEKVYTCELDTVLHLSDNSQLTDKVEVDKKCEHIF